MKLFVPALVFALTQLALPGASENQLRSVDESWPGYGVTFLDDSPLPDTMLMASESAHFSMPSTTCTATSTGNAKLEVLVSKCLSSSKLADIKAWIQLFVKTLTFGVPSSITVVVSPVPGACPGSLVLLSEGDDDDRFAIFNDIATVVDVFGAAAPATDASSNATTVVSTDATADVSANVTSEALLADLVLPNGLPSIAAMKSIGIVSFVDTYSSATLVEQYELNLEAASFNFFVCNSLLNCLTCSTCKVTADINMIDPYTVTTALQCPNHQNAIPVSYLESGERKCVCQCPPGYKRKSSGVGCEKVGGTVSSCSWATTQGFEVPNTATGTCAVSNIADKGVPVPVAIDNYVAKGRTNTFSTPGQLSTGPFIKLLNGDGTTSTYYEWDDYRLHRKAKIDALTFNSYGKYTLKITAKDYQSEAVCTGCLTIVDNVRPSTTAECPAAYQVAGAEPSATATTLTAIRAKVDTFFNFQPSAVNDGCSSARCDAESITAVQFPGSTSQAPAYTSTAAKAFFSEDNIRSELTSLGALATTALSASTPATSGQCRRCLTLATTLKEYWTDYNCVGADAAPACAGTQSCSYTQCYTVSGDSIATQTVSIKSTVKDASQQVINQIEDRASFNKDTQVHFPLSHCDKFASTAADASLECKTSQKLDELFDLATDKSTVLGFTKDAASALVSWRYKVDGGAWAAWPGSNVEYTFYKPTTTVEFQAWTKCGQVGATVSFPVHLHIHAESKVCDYFCDMWYQTTHNKASPSSKELCMYPKADFAELTFDYHANIGLMYAKDKINMNIKEVTCTLHYDWTAATDKVEIVTSTTQDADIIKRIAVVAKRNPQTAALSGISVECMFKYKVFGKTELYEQSCPETFSIKDCTDPVIDEPPSSVLSDPTCAADNCVTSGGPGPYEACGGNVVSVTSGAAVLTTADQTCCQFCSPKFTTTCQALPQLPSGNSDIKLCVPTSSDSTATKYFGTNLLLATASEAISKSVATNPTATALLSASAMVALVALVVVRRRRAASASAGDVVVDDAYYPLLE